MDLLTSKVVAMVGLGVGSFVVGVLPAWFSPSGRRKFPLGISALLCFGGGVLLATSIIHMLPEARENLPQYAEVALCAGFLLVYLVDEVVHLCFGRSIDSSDSDYSVVEASSRDDFVRRRRNPSTSAGFRRVSYGSVANDSLLQADFEDDGQRQSFCEDDSNSRLCHVNHAEPCNKSATGRIGLLGALLLHSILEGLAIGLQESPSKVILLFGAVASHKFVVGFCLGVELAEAIEGKICAHIIAITVFSTGSVVGIGVGAVIDGLDVVWTNIAMPILQALAAGTLLYVTVSEVLPRERARWHHKPQKAAGVYQVLAVTAGFLVMYFLNAYVGEDHNSTPVKPEHIP